MGGIEGGKQEEKWGEEREIILYFFSPFTSYPLKGLSHTFSPQTLKKPPTFLFLANSHQLLPGEVWKYRSQANPTTGSTYLPSPRPHFLSVHLLTCELTTLLSKNPPSILGHIPPGIERCFPSNTLLTISCFLLHACVLSGFSHV